MKLRIVKFNCERCGKEIFGTNMAINPKLQALKEATPHLCESCTTEEDRLTLDMKILEKLKG